MTTELLNTLYVQTQGTFLQLDHDTVRIRLPEGETRRLPLSRLDCITLIGRVMLTPALLARCADDGRTIVWLDRRGVFRGRLQGRVGGNVLLRRAQHQLFEDASGCLRLARNIVAGKVQNTRQIVLRAARDANDTSAGHLDGRQKDWRVSLPVCRNV